MNGKKAKLLRKLIGFKPSAPRTYKGGVDVGYSLFGGMKIVTTQISEGARRQYQAVKRRGMTKHVLGAKHA